MLGFEAEINSLQGDRGEWLQDDSYFIGQFEAEQINIQERLKRDIEDAIRLDDTSLFDDEFYSLNFDEDVLKDNIERISEMSTAYMEAYGEQDWTKCGEVLKRVETEAQIAYAESYGAKSILDSELALYEHTSRALAESPQLAESARLIGEAMQKGVLSGLSDGFAEKAIQALGLTGDSLHGRATEGGSSGDLQTRATRGGNVPSESGNTITSGTDLLGGSTGRVSVSGNAWGLPYVPYDDYLTRLHEGERVLTAAEARAYGSGGTPTININGNFTVREEADIYKIAQELAAQINRAQQIS